MPLVNVKLTGGPYAPTEEQKAEIIKEMTDVLVRVLNKKPETTVVIIEEVHPDAWGVGGQSVTERSKK